jgi:hypothetical protein
MDTLKVVLEFMYFRSKSTVEERYVQTYACWINYTRYQNMFQMKVTEVIVI